MYDFVIMLLFDETTTTRIQAMKDKLYRQGVSSREKPWPPHVTVDLYQEISITDLLEAVDSFIDSFSAFSVSFSNLACFGNRVLYLKPEPHPSFKLIKEQADKRLGAYIIENNRKRQVYIPHITLAINNDITTAKRLIEPDFQPFSGRISCLAVYSRRMVLQEKYQLV